MSRMERSSLVQCARQAPPGAPVRSAGKCWGFASVPFWAFWAVGVWPCVTLAGLSPAGSAAAAACIITKDHSSRRRQRRAFLASCACCPPGPLALYRLLGGLLSGLHSRDVLIVMVRRTVSERAEGALLWTVSGGQ